MTEFVTDFKTNLPIAKTGGKGYSLAILAKSAFSVPDGFIVTSSAFFEFLKQNHLFNEITNLVSILREANLQDVSQEIRSLILEGEVPREIITEIADHLSELETSYVSIRSSAVSEDSAIASFAGLFDTFLHIRAELPLVLENVKQCWASLFNSRAMVYRMEKGMPHFGGMAVIIQKMIRAEISGVTFTRHPLEKKVLVIEASYGLGDLIVGGKIEPDEFTVNRETLEILEKRTGQKSRMSILKNNELRVIDAPHELAKKLTLTDSTVKEIAATCLKVERVFNAAQDIEWCISDDNVWLLQSRPISKPARTYYEEK